MEELVILLRKFISKDTKYHDFNDIKKSLKLKGEEKEYILKNALNLLIEDGTIFYDKKYGYRVFPTTDGYAYGKLEINKAGTGFVHTNNGYTILIENCDLNGALNGDSVIVSNICNYRKDYYHGEIYKIVKRNTGNVVFEVIGNGKNATLVAYNSNDNINVYIDSNQLKNLIDGNLVLVNVGCNSNDGIFHGDIVQIIGHKDDPNIDIKMILEKNNLSIDFSEETLKEAKNMPAEVKENELLGRVDLRDENIFTIDCDSTKDRDDAVGIKKLENGNYLLKVSIAHVSHYVKEGSKIFDEAIKRCFSYYLDNTCLPMLPRELSNGICSLNEGVDRLTRTVEMEINSQGKIVNYNIYNSVINSKKAMSYSNVNKVLAGESVFGYDEFKYDIELMNELNTILQKERENRNYIDFKTSEIETVREKDKIVGFKKNDYATAGEIIENFMLVANTTVYSNYAWFVLAYRIHECPNEEKVKEVISILQASGIRVPNIKNADARSLKTIIDNLNDSEASEIARECLLRSMKKAKYSTTNEGHFALQYSIYGHFTSPIRRIIDLLTHMIIDNIEEYNIDEESFEKFEKLLNDVCDRANRLEKVSKEMEEEAIDMRMAEYMKQHIGEEFEVIVTDINRHSMLVRTTNNIRGKIKLEDMLDDDYHYDYDKLAIVGRNTKKKYQIGSKEVVLVKSAFKETRTVNFEVPKQKVLKNKFM